MIRIIAGLVLISIILPCVEIKAQGYAESALIFSRVQPGGTARIQGLGSAQTALGGDISSALSNPAGLGMYNRSEFSFTPLFNMNTYNNDYLGNTSSNQKNMLALASLGLAVNSGPSNGKKFISGTMGLTYTRINDFNQRYSYQGLNQLNSIVDLFIEQSNGRPETQFDQINSLQALAYQNYLIGPLTVIDPSLDPNTYFSDVIEFGAVANQTEIVDIKGSGSQWSISYGANFMDMFFVGAGLGITGFRYQSVKNFREEYIYPDDEDVIPVNSMSMMESLDLNGTGINFVFGAIVRPIEYFQIGLSYTTPTYYSLEDIYEASMRSSWNNFDYYVDGSTILNNESATTPLFVDDYNLTTPARLRAGATFFADKYGFVTMDVEMVNHSNARYRSSVFGPSFDGDNENIRTLYTQVYNIRTGAEARLDIFRIRAGYARMADPYRNPGNFSRVSNNFSLGTGVRTKSVGVDVVYVHHVFNNQYAPYFLSDASHPVSVQKFVNNMVMATVGFTF